MYARDTVNQERISQKRKKFETQRTTTIYMDLYENHLNSSLGLWALKKLIPKEINEHDRYLGMFNALTQTVRSLPSGVNLEEKLMGSKNLVLGGTIPDSIQFDTKGDPVVLSDFRGKYVLVDFWASWCVPCRNVNPQLVKVWKEYIKKPFTIVSIALEHSSDREDWLNAINEDGLTWIHLTDFKYWNNALVKTLGIGYIPYNLLLDPDGKIIGLNLKNDELTKKLAELLN